ncbi:4869_t:CDS:2, partial [Entrophospora sp. SA101]
NLRKQKDLIKEEIIRISKSRKLNDKIIYKELKNGTDQPEPRNQSKYSGKPTNYVPTQRVQRNEESQIQTDDETNRKGRKGKRNCSKERNLPREKERTKRRTFRCSNCGETTHAYANCPKVRCGECGELGHIKKFCKNKKCNKCGELGHIRKDCYNYTTKEIMIARKESEENHDTKFTPTEN